MANYIQILLLISFAIIAFVYVKTYNAVLDKEKKIALYVVTFIMPIVGLILYFVFNNKATSSKTVA
ncbi:MAG: hypothetical protein KF763_14100 [Cyclobacteriaceae bacterium]|nr:hypothetical protein [Cyclobacteriaceae bacterium]